MKKKTRSWSQLTREDPQNLRTRAQSPVQDMSPITPFTHAIIFISHPPLLAGNDQCTADLLLHICISTEKQRQNRRPPVESSLKPQFQNFSEHFYFYVSSFKQLLKGCKCAKRWKRPVRYPQCCAERPNLLFFFYLALNS